MDLTRRYRFCASHRLHSPNLPDETNRQVYGKCNNPHGHGHNYELELTVSGPVNPVTGRVADLLALDAFVQKYVIEIFDHRNLNEEVKAFQQLVPTTENLCVILDRDLRDVWPAGFPALKRLSIWETPRNIFVL